MEQVLAEPVAEEPRPRRALHERVARWFPLGCALVAGAGVSAAHALAPPVPPYEEAAPSRSMGFAALEPEPPVMTLPFITMPPPPAAFLPSTAAPGARVTIGPPLVGGRLPGAVVARVLHAHRERFRRCYAEGLANDGALSGEVHLRFVIGRDGAVSVAGQGASNMPDPQVAGCVVDAMRGATFPAPDGGIATVLVAVRFAPSS